MVNFIISLRVRCIKSIRASGDMGQCYVSRSFWVGANRYLLVGNVLNVWEFPLGFPDSRGVAQSIATQRMDGPHGGAGTPTCDIFDVIYE